MQLFLCEFDLVRLPNSIEINPWIKFDWVRLGSIHYAGTTGAHQNGVFVLGSANFSVSKPIKPMQLDERLSLEENRNSTNFLNSSAPKIVFLNSDKNWSINSSDTYPPGQPRGICWRCQSREWGIRNFTATWGWATPGHLTHVFSKDDRVYREGRGLQLSGTRKTCRCF